MRTCKGQPTQPNVHTHLWSITKSIKKFSPVVFAFFPKQPHFRAGGRSATGAQSELLKALLGSTRLAQSWNPFPGKVLCFSARSESDAHLMCPLAASTSPLRFVLKPGKTASQSARVKKGPLFLKSTWGGGEDTGRTGAPWRCGAQLRSVWKSRGICVVWQTGTDTRRSLMRQHFYLVTCNPGQFRILFWFLPLIFSWVWCLGIRQMSHPPRARITTGPRNRFTHASSDGTKGQFVD